LKFRGILKRNLILHIQNENFTRNTNYSDLNYLKLSAIRPNYLDIASRVPGGP